MLGAAISSLPLRLSLTEWKSERAAGPPERANRLQPMGITLYGTPPSPPSHSARLMLEHKGIDHKVVWLLPGMWPALLRTRGFRSGTVPALKMNGRRVQGSVLISRALEQIKPEPALFPSDPEQRLAVEDA